MQAPMMISSLFLSVLATTALALPQPHFSPFNLLPETAVVVRDANQPSVPREDIESHHALAQALKRTDSTGAGAQTSVGSYMSFSKQ
jgi:hypothetical protein